MSSKYTRRNNPKASSTAGKLKGPNCQKSELKVRLAKDSRFYRTSPSDYAEVSEIVRKLNM